MRTLSLGATLAILLALPLVGASGLTLEAEVHADAEGATVDAPASAPAVEAPASLSSGDLVKTSLSPGADGSGGLEFTARASAGDGEDEPLSKTVLPVVEEAAPAAVATVGVVALLQAFGVWRILGLGAFALYSRLTKSDLLDNEHRDRVYRLIQERPGLGVSEIAQLTGLGWGTTVYHLDRLERHGFVAPERGGLHKCYYPVGTVAREARKGLGALKADTTRSIAQFLVARPGATQTELCEALGLSASAASKQVSKLEDAGLVRRERDWKTVHLFPAETLAPLLSGESAPAPTPPALETPVAPPLAA